MLVRDCSSTEIDLQYVETAYPCRLPLYTRKVSIYVGVAHLL